jgi:mono/diheme cytochrome c family protein
MRRVLALALVAVVLLAFGCGGGSSSPDQRSTSNAAVNGGPPAVLEVNVPPGDESGKRIVAQSGCLACHKIGESGNGSLGPNLTRIGARESRESILRTLKAGPGIMPSFQNLGEERLSRVASFLAHLN